jgi:hypothetical protein
MTSTFAWLDYSDRDRKRAMDMVDLFREDDTRDELGIGVIRDAFADRLFPATSTIHTRVRYLLFVPWVFQTLNARDALPDRFAQRLRQQQDRLRESLVKGGQQLGVIGFLAGRAVQRLPSSVYWQGLRRLGMLRFNGSEYDYRNELSQRGAGVVMLTTDDGEPVDDTQKGFWDPRLPRAPDNWFDATTFDLTQEEAEYLEHRFNMAAGDSLLAHLIQLGAVPEEASFAWEHVPPDDLPVPLNEELTHARYFSESMQGAFLLYNLMLAEGRRSAELIDAYQIELAGWWDRLHARSADLTAWDRPRFWVLLAAWNARVTPASHSFVEAWLEAITEARGIEEVMKDRGLRSLITFRERVLKGARARLDNPRALNLWNGASGTAQLDYRWNRPVTGMLRDLLGARAARP